MGEREGERKSEIRKTMVIVVAMFYRFREGKMVMMCEVNKVILYNLEGCFPQAPSVLYI